VSSGEENYRFSVFGVTSMIAELYDLYPNQGEFFIDEDIAAKADVVVIGETVREKLFGQSKALGERIKIKDRKYRIVGILPKKGQGSLVNFDDILIIPYTNAQSYLMGIKYYNRIVVEADTDLNVEATIADIKRTLRDSHNISDPEKDDFYLMTSSDITQRVKTVTDVLTILLASVAAISLLVGGVGIMNIVLVSVTERTREIGLRKALGATKNDILYQFLLESVILTASGGVVGVVLGTIFSFLASVILSQATGSLWRFSFPYGAALLGFLVSAGVGLIFGVYPARKAAQLNPIEALRYE
ncbi:MAG TPA: ABC transporter permease, partial [Candidatus Pacearchaeota archaeon]|nr:ABC transporter permease [Candidatus Pacearchaeota archaeon]